MTLEIYDDTIEFTTVTDALDSLRSDIDTFLCGLHSERKYIFIDTEGILQSKFIILARKNSEIVGLTGLKMIWSIFPRSYIIVKKDYHGTQLGKTLKMRIIEEIKKKYSYMLTIVIDENLSSMILNLSTGSRIVGKQANLYFLINPFNTRGLSFYYMIKILFPVFKLCRGFTERFFKKSADSNNSPSRV